MPRFSEKHKASSNRSRQSVLQYARLSDRNTPLLPGYIEVARLRFIICPCPDCSRIGRFRSISGRKQISMVLNMASIVSRTYRPLCRLSQTSRLVTRSRRGLASKHEHGDHPVHVHPVRFHNVVDTHCFKLRAGADRYTVDRLAHCTDTRQHY